MSVTCIFRRLTFLVTAIVLLIPLGGLLLAGSDPVDIADLDLEGLLNDVVTSASKHAESLDEAPANVCVVTREMIDDYGCRSIGEALSLVPGMYVSDDYMLSQIGLRGAAVYGDWNSRVMVLVDGRPTTEQYGGSNSIDVLPVSIDDIERIEVVKGPASSLYGSNAFLGIVNLITRRPKDESLRLSTDYSTDVRRSRSNGSLLTKFDNGLEVYLSGTWTDRKGNDLFFNEFSQLSDASLTLDDDGYYQFYLDSTDFTGGHAREKNGLENHSARGRISWGPYYLSGSFVKQRTQVPLSYYGSLFARPENRYEEEHRYVDLGYQGRLSSLAELTARASYHRYKFNDEILYNYYAEEEDPAYLPGPLWRDVEYDRAFSGEARLELDLTEGHTMILGAEIQQHQVEQQSGEVDISTGQLYENVIPDEHARADGSVHNLYAQDDLHLFRNVKLVTGLHFNHYSFTGGRLTPKAALVISPYKYATYKLIASQGYRSPTFYEMTFDDQDYYAPNPDLRPEIINSLDLIVGHDLPYGVSIVAAGNYSGIEDMIVHMLLDSSSPHHPGGDYADEVLQFRNVGEVHIHSLELSVSRQAVYRLSGFANLTYQSLKVLDVEQHSESFNSPRWLANFGLNYQIRPRRISVATKVNYISSRKDWDGGTLAGYAIVDAAVRFQHVLEGLTLTLGSKNLLNEYNATPLSQDYAPSATIEGPGRAWYFQLETEFAL